MKPRPDPRTEPPIETWLPLGKPPADCRVLAVLTNGPLTLSTIVARAEMFPEAGLRAATWALRHGYVEAIPAIGETERLIGATVLQITDAGRERLRGRR